MNDIMVEKWEQRLQRLYQEDFNKDNFPNNGSYLKTKQPSSEGSMSSLEVTMLLWLGKADLSVLCLLNTIASIELKP